MQATQATQSYEERYCSLKNQVLERSFGRMNSMQRRAVFKINGPLLILAGAGSGKTTVLIHRIENMIRFGNAYECTDAPQGLSEDDLRFLEACAEAPPEGDDAGRLEALIRRDTVRPWNILAITFTNKAAGELRERLEARLGPTALDIQASTFHSLCVRILRREIEAIGYARNFTIYDTDDSLRVIKASIKSAGLDEKMFQPRAVLSAIGRQKDKLHGPAEMLQEAKDDYRVSGMARVYEAYQKALRDANALDFDDLILLTVRLFQSCPEVLARYQNRYRYIMVDEYQDTNHAQYLLISQLAAAHQNLCVVGDDDQSIYKFRGATIENILSFEEQFPGAAVIRLEQNYRSTQNILSAANGVIENNTARKGKNLWTDAGSGEKILHALLRDELEEARFIADAILENVKAGAKFSDHAVLYRMNAQSNAVEKVLARSALPYRIVGGLRFYERKEIKDMVAYMSLLNNHNDALRLLRIVNEPKRGIGASTLTAAQEIAAQLGESLYEIISTADQYAPLAKKSGALMQFAAMIERLTEFAETQPLGDLVDAILDETGYRTMLEGQGVEGAGRLENIMELTTNIVKYAQASEEPSLSEFLEEIALYTDLDNYDAGADAVVLMTVHSSKGLEFPYIYLVGMDEGLFPGRSAQNFPEEIEEERRLAYVAITRAKRRVTLTSAQRRMIFGQTVWGRPSRFVEEIPPDLVDRDDHCTTKQSAGIPAGTQRRSGSGTTIGVGTTAAGAGGKAATQSTDSYAVGERVKHSVFGEGVIQSARSLGGDTLLEIAFDTAGAKKLMANFARLTKV